MYPLIEVSNLSGERLEKERWRNSFFTHFQSKYKGMSRMNVIRNSMRLIVYLLRMNDRTFLLPIFSTLNNSFLSFTSFSQSIPIAIIKYFQHLSNSLPFMISSLLFSRIPFPSKYFINPILSIPQMPSIISIPNGEMLLTLSNSSHLFEYSFIIHHHLFCQYY